MRLAVSCQGSFPSLVSCAKPAVANSVPDPAAIPPKVDKLLRSYEYTPYSSFSPAARLKTRNNGEEEVIVSTNGTFRVKGVSRAEERRITMIEWRVAAKIVEEKMGLYHNEERQEMFRKHHDAVEELASSFSWELAVEYDITQRELAAADWSHDLGSLDNVAVSRLYLQSLSISRGPASVPAPATPSRKRHAPSDEVTPAPAKRIASGNCFRCGGAGHVPADCVATTTSAGRKPATVLQGGSHRNTLLATNGKQYCFRFARRSCASGGNCSNFHGCSLCGDTSHGAASCTRSAN